MGTVCRVVFRSDRNEVICRNRSAKQIVEWLKHPYVWSRSEGHMRDFMDKSLEPPNQRQAVQFPPKAHEVDQPLTHREYGLIVIDHRDNVFLSGQNYTSMNRISPLEMAGMVYPDLPKQFSKFPDYSLVLRKRHFSTIHRRTEITEEFSEPIKTRDALMMARELVEIARDNIDAFSPQSEDDVVSERLITQTQTDFIIRDTDLRFQEFGGRGADVLIMLRALLKDHCFRLNHSEEQEWERSIQAAMLRR